MSSATATLPTISSARGAATQLPPNPRPPSGGGTAGRRGRVRQETSIGSVASGGAARGRAAREGGHGTMTPAVLMQSIKAANDELQVAELERDLIQAERDDVLTGAANARGPGGSRGTPSHLLEGPLDPLRTGKVA